MKILITGGCGYIGSHTAVLLIENGYDVVVVDNLSNSKEEVINYIEVITGKKVKFYKGDICNKNLLKKIFIENKIDAVIHFAGYKAVGESVNKPLMYYRNNIDSTLSICEIMEEFNCKKIVFSSSATVYGNPEELPISEESPLSTTNPYGSTKLYIEGILKDLCISDKEFSAIVLRYFNPVGAHSSGLIGENPNGIPNNLIPYINKVAMSELEYLNVFGNDYDTKDGTGVRDYIHIMDLANGHIKALERLMNIKGIEYYNLGTGVGYSVLDIINTYEKVNNVKIPYKIVDRRPGDIAECYADVTKSYKNLNWTAKYDLEDMLKSAYEYIIKSKS